MTAATATIIAPDAPVERIALSVPDIGEHEQRFVDEAFAGNWIGPLGPNLDAFERELAARVGAGKALAVSSGTAGLHLALRCLGVGSEDRVFCSSLTFAASVNPIRYLGAEPVFVDSDPDTWCMSPRALERALQAAQRKGRLPKVVLVVNLYGQSADFRAIESLCGSYGVPIVEDAAESLGATFEARASGTIGRIGVYSFNGNKIITTGGGGAIVSDDVALVDRARHLATQAREARPEYHHLEVGYNYRMSNVQAGIGRGQLRVLDARIAARRGVFDRYRKLLAHIPEITWMPEAPFGQSSRWLSVATLTSGGAATRDALLASLDGAGIEARHVWKPMHRQPVFEAYDYIPHEVGFSVSDRLYGTGFCLPSSSSLTEAQQHRVVHAIDAALAP